MNDNRGDKRGRSPGELAGYDIQTLPIAEFFAGLKLPAPRALTPQTMSP